MKELEMLLKKMRVEEIAAEIGVSASSVWNWKSGAFKPSRMAESRLKELAKKNEAE